MENELVMQEELSLLLLMVRNVQINAKLEQRAHREKQEKKVGVARLKPTRDDNSKDTRIGPSLFHTSKLQSKYIK